VMLCFCASVISWLGSSPLTFTITAEYPTNDAALSAAVAVCSLTLTPVKIKIESGSFGNKSIGSYKTVPRTDLGNFPGLKSVRISSVLRSEKAFSKSDKRTSQP